MYCILNVSLHVDKDFVLCVMLCCEAKGQGSLCKYACSRVLLFNEFNFKNET